MHFNYSYIHLKQLRYNRETEILFNRMRIWNAVKMGTPCQSFQLFWLLITVMSHYELGLQFKSAFLVLSTTQSTLQYMPTFTHWHTHSYTDGRGCHARCQPARNISMFTHSNTHSHTHRWLDGSCPRTLRHTDQGEPGDWTTNLPISGQPALPPEPQPPLYTYS